MVKLAEFRLVAFDAAVLLICQQNFQHFLTTGVGDFRDTRGDISFFFTVNQLAAFNGMAVCRDKAFVQSFLYDRGGHAQNAHEHEQSNQ